MGLKGICEICGLTSSTILINLCVERSQIGAVNGRQRCYFGYLTDLSIFEVAFAA